jgi:proteasome lid subunit RPN8/RPN11
METRISRGVLAELAALAAGSGVEICGLLFGDDVLIDAFAPAANVAPDPRRHFEIDPATLIAAHRAARSGGPGVAGYYHSHPSGVAEPSATDIASAVADGALWLILAAGGARLWVAEAGEDGGTAFRERAFAPI